MSLFSSIATASTALQAFSSALGADQTNVSNSATPGFAAIRATVRAIGTSSEGFSGTDSVELSSTGSPQADALVQSASSQSSESQTATGQLEPVNQLFDITGASGILAALNNFSTAFSSLTVNPNDLVGRTTALLAAGGVASAFNKVAARLDSQRNSVDSIITSTVANINQLASQIRRFNVSVRGQTQLDPGTDAALRSTLDQLSSLTGITVLKNGDGTVSVLTGGQQPLVIGDQVYSLGADPAAAPGSQVSSSGGGNSPTSYSGQLGALLDFRNGTLHDLLGGNGAAGTVNELAKGFASRVNSLFSAGVTASGAPGVPVFSYDNVNDSNVARTLAVDPTVTTDQLALSTTGASPQSNGVAVALAGLASSTQVADQIDGLSPQGLFASIAASVGRKLADSRTQSATDQTTFISAQAARQQVSGVSLDQEAVSITAFQRSYQASAKLISILNDLTSTEVNLIR
ncbi:MAG: flagellar hook-associated protein 1 [Bryobacterales bacterium]|jgi:flagellar hook-associated protein 1 FlgK|nr:flagellar hook-associated protein 1 [Bryobacterales bacterium]